MRSRTVNGHVEKAFLSAKAPGFAFRRTRATAAQRAGIRYHRRLTQRFDDQYSHEFIPEPWFKYRASGGRQWAWCQPDGLLIQPKRLKITVLEFKLKHTRDAWEQLFLLYLPVVSRAFGVGTQAAPWRFAACEVVQWFDSAERCPEPPALCVRPEDSSPGAFGVCICKA